MRILRACLLVSSLVIGFVANMHALLITPGSDSLLKDDFSSNSQSVIDSEMNSFLDTDFRLAYKQNVGGSEEGPFATEYSTSFNSSNSGATINLDVSGFLITDGAYLLVKDGRHEPYAYLFDISGWDGEETIELRDFWPGPGSISHVSIYRVPDGGTTLMLLGIAFVGLAAVRKWNRLPTVCAESKR